MTTSAFPEAIELSSQHLYLELLPIAPSRLTFSTVVAQRRADLNQACMVTFIDWCRTDKQLDAQVWPNVASLPSFWEIVNGTTIVVGEQRFCLIPTEAIDADELRVPQEWVDIPSWVADYYLLVYVDRDAGYLQIVGHASHAMLKTMRHYDTDDRTYSLATEDLIADINVIWLAQEFCADQVLRSSVADLAAIDADQSVNLITRLGQADLAFPRLAVPFTLWGALIEHGGWRQRLYEQRQGLAESWSLSQWLQTGLSQLATQMGWQLGVLNTAPVTLGTRSVASESASLIRELTIDHHPYQLHITPQGDAANPVWRFTLVSAIANRPIPAGFTLRLLTEDLQPFEHNADTAITPMAQLYVEVMLAVGEGIVWEIEPQPEGYDREILRF